MGIIINFFTRLTDHLIESPCIAVCKMDAATGLCAGCYRTLDEIERWPQMNGDQKRDVNRQAAERKACRSVRD